MKNFLISFHSILLLSSWIVWARHHSLLVNEPKRKSEQVHVHKTNFKASHTKKIMKFLSVQYCNFPKAWTTKKNHVKLNSRLFLINLPTTCWRKLGWGREKWKPCFGSKSGRRCLSRSSEREVKTLRGSMALWSTAFIPWGSESTHLKCEQQHLKPQNLLRRVLL